MPASASRRPSRLHPVPHLHLLSLRLCALVFAAVLAASSTASAAVVTVDDPPEKPLLAPEPAVPGALRLSWFGRSGFTYFIQQTRDLSDLSWQYLPIIETGEDASLSYVFGSVPQPAFFARLRIADQTAEDPLTADFDGDGIGNMHELLHFLDPLDAADSDGDGFPDDWERFYLGGTATAGSRTADQNGDGITDWEAWLLGLNPTGQASDRNPPQWTADATLSGSSGTVLMTLNWPAAVDPEGGAVSYVLYRNGVPQGASITATSHETDISDLVGWQRWHVRPVDAAGNHGAPTSLLELQLGTILDVPFEPIARSVSATRSYWGYSRSDPEKGTRYFQTQTNAWSWTLTKEERRSYDWDVIVASTETYTGSGSLTTVSTKRQDDTTSSTSSGAASGTYTYHSRDFGTQRFISYSGTYNAAGRFSGDQTDTFYYQDGSETTNYEQVESPKRRVSADRRVSSSPTVDVYENSNDNYTIGTPGPNQPVTEYVMSATRTVTYSDELTPSRMKELLRASLPPLDSLSWGDGDACAVQQQIGGAFDLAESQYRVRLEQTSPEYRYRTRWLEVFYPKSGTGTMRALAARSVLIAGTGGVAESDVYSLSVPDELEGGICPVPITLSLEVPSVLPVNEDFDERVETVEGTPWTSDAETPSPLRADGKFVADDLAAIWIGSNGDTTKAYREDRFGPETSGVRLSVTEGAECVRLHALAPKSGSSPIYGPGDWIMLDGGEELWGICFGLQTEGGYKLPDWTLYIEGLQPGKAVVRLEVDRYGYTLVEERTVFVTRVSLQAWDAEDGALSPVGAFHDEETPSPEVSLTIDSAELRSDGALEIQVSGHVRDQLGELFADPASCVAGLVLWVNGQAVEAVSNLPAQGSGPGLVPWQNGGSRVEFTRTLVVNDVRPGGYVVEARSTPNLAGQRGSAKAGVRIGYPVVANPPAPTSADVTLAFSAPLDPAAPDQVRVYRGARAPTANDPIFTETGPDTRIFTGFWMTDEGLSVAANLQLARSPLLTPTRIEEIGATFTWSPAPGLTKRAEGRWAESAADARWFVPAQFIDPDPPRELRVSGIYSLSDPDADEDATNVSRTPRPVVVKFEGLPADLPADNLPVYPLLGDEVGSLVYLDLDGGGWFLGRPGGQATPLSLLGSARTWTPPTDEVKLFGPTTAASSAAGAGGDIGIQSLAAPTELALKARAMAAGRRGMAEAQAYLEEQGYYDEDPAGGMEREPLTLEELRGWTLLAYDRPAYIAMTLFDKLHGVVEFVEVSWWSPGVKMRGYELSPNGHPLKLQIDASLEPMRAAEVFMDALTQMIGYAHTRDLLLAMSADRIPEHPFTEADFPMLLAANFRSSWGNNLGKIETLFRAQEAGMRLLFAPVDMVVTITEAIEGDKAAMLSVTVAATPIDNVAGITRKIVKGSDVIQLFSPALQPVIRQVLSEQARFMKLRKAREMIANGALPLAKWQELVGKGILKLKRPRAAAKRAKLAADELTKTPANKVLHHYLPLEFENDFLKAGLDPNDPMFTAWVDYGKHLGWHSGTGLGLGGYFNYEWRLFFRSKPNATEAQILTEFNRLKQQFSP